MCGRFALHSQKERIIQQYSAQMSFEFEPNYNTGPGQLVVILKGQQGRAVASQVEWGVKPSWGDGKSKLLINARCESVHEKSTFVESFKTSRCVFVADGWFEWLRQDGAMKPYYFSRKDSRIFAFAGIVVDGKGVVLTRKAPERLAAIHDRAPLMLTREQVSGWLGDRSFSYVSDRAVKQFDTSIIQYFPVSPKVNSIKNNERDLIYEFNGC